MRSGRGGRDAAALPLEPDDVRRGRSAGAAVHTHTGELHGTKAGKRADDRHSSGGDSSSGGGWEESGRSDDGEE